MTPRRLCGVRSPPVEASGSAVGRRQAKAPGTSQFKRRLRVSPSVAAPACDSQCVVVTPAESPRSASTAQPPLDLSVFPTRPLSAEALRAITPDKAAAVLVAYAAGYTLRAACLEYGLRSADFRAYLRAHPEHKPAWTEAEAAHIEYLEERAMELAHAATPMNPQALMFLLRARLPHRYKENVAVQHSGSIDFAGSFAQAMERVASGSQPSTTQH